jgi:AAA+ ATPase superfamily predicted ATPase
MLPVAEARPAAIKGPMAFTPEDGPLFRRLCREDELAKLLSHVLDNQIPLVVTMGESGVGKTSLLRAGLSNALAQKSVRYIYWEALPSDPAARLLHAIAGSWDTAKNGPLPQNLDEALTALSSSPAETVIVLDQFEQLHPENPAHDGVFELLRRIATKEDWDWHVGFERSVHPEKQTAPHDG